MFLGVFESQNSNFIGPIRPICQGSIRTVSRITFLKNVLNTHYVIRSKSWDNPDTH